MAFEILWLLELRLVFFFFQAEDGIRDLIVTGVQTCALPICTAPASTWASATRRRVGGALRTRRRVALAHVLAGAVQPAQQVPQVRRERVEIGRASCRERGEISVGAVSVKKKRRRVGRGNEVT